MSQRFPMSASAVAVAAATAALWSWLDPRSGSDCSTRDQAVSAGRSGAACAGDLPR